MPYPFRCAFAGLLLCLASCAAADDAPAYRLDPSFPQLPAGVKLGAGAGVATDSKGNVFVFHRAEPPILVFSPTGQFLRSFGENLFKSAHGMRIDSGDNLWVTDNADHTVMRFDPAGKLTLTLGEKGKPGEDATHFNKPTDVTVAKNGDFFVADGYGNSRIVKFDKTGKFLMTWGKKGKGESQFNLPHAVRLDSEGLLYVGDRENRRIQVFKQDGTFIRQFAGMSPYGLFITPEDSLFVADGRANKIVKLTPEGKVLTSWGIEGSKPGDFHLPHGITVAADGAVYVTEVDGKRVQKFVPVPPQK